MSKRATKTRSSWSEKLDQSKGLPKVVPIGPTMSKQWGEGTVVVPAPREVDAIMKSVPSGKLITIQEIRAIVAERHGATIGCPLTVGIFAWIAAHAAEDDRKAKRRGATPYWRTLKSGGYLEREVSRRRPGPQGEARGRRARYHPARAEARRGGLRALSGQFRRDRLMAVGDDRGRSPGAPLPELVLASTSVYRRALLERLGVPFRWRAPLCDEESFKSERIDPRSLAETLAHAKAASLVEAEPDAAIIGCDQVVSFQGQVFGKPGSVDRRVEQLSAMAGQTHELITALVVIHGERTFRHTDVTTLRMRRLSRAAIERYVAADQPLDCAGAYKLESRGIVLFEQDRVGRSHGHHGPAADRAGDDPCASWDTRFRESGRRCAQDVGHLTKQTPGVGIM